MSIERKEPTLSNFNTSNSSAEKPTRPSQPAQSPSSSQARPVQQRVARPQVIVQKQPSLLLWLALCTALFASAFAGYGFWQLQQAQAVLLSQNGRINDLEQKLELSGDESAQSLTTLTASLRELRKEIKVAMSEVDKLWATRNVNKKATEDNKQQIEAGLSKANTLISALQDSVATLSEPVTILQQSKVEQELLLQSLRERFSEQQQLLNEVEETAKDFASKSTLKELQKQINAQNEAVKSFDKFRLSVNRDLLTLKRQISTASTPPK